MLLRCHKKEIIEVRSFYRLNDDKNMTLVGHI